MNQSMNTPLPHDDDAAVLDADLLDAFAAACTADPVEPLVAEDVKRRMLGRIAEATTPTNLTVQPTSDTWRPFLPGVRIKVLNEADGIMSYLLKLAPGATVDAHHHPIDEECVVLEGSLQVGKDLLLQTGAFHMARRDTIHTFVTTATGATIFLRGATPRVADLV
jgi:quercetin dioxygenase-like cupin family protein